VDPLDDEVDLIEAFGGGPDILPVEALQVETLQVLFFAPCSIGGIKLGIPQFFVKGVEPFGFEEVVDSLTPLAAEVEGPLSLLLDNHHRFVELQMAVGTGDTGQRDSSFGDVVVFFSLLLEQGREETKTILS
jgi:hypothetical protein